MEEDSRINHVEPRQRQVIPITRPWLTLGLIRPSANTPITYRSGVNVLATARSGVDQAVQNRRVPITRPCATRRVFLCARYGVVRPLIGTGVEQSTIDVLDRPV